MMFSKIFEKIGKQPMNVMDIMHFYSSMRYISVQKEKNGILYQQTFMGE